MNLTR